MKAQTIVLLFALIGISSLSLSPLGVKVASSLQDEMVQDPWKVTESIFIDSVWSGHRVRFALLTEGQRQYIAYYNADRHTVVGQRNLSDEQFELFRLPPKERDGREGTSTILGWDSHNSLTLAVDEQGYIHMSGNMHANGLTYFRTSRPHDITSIVQVDQMVGDKENRCTYPVFIKRKDGQLIFRYRDGGSGNGNNIYNIYDANSKTWRRLHDPLVDGQGLMNAYTTRPKLGSDGWYHFIWVWRDTPDCETNHDLSYAKSPDLESWYDVYNNKVSLPINYNQKSLIIDPVPPGGGIINGCAQLVFDAEDRPMVVYHKYDPQGYLQLYASRFLEGTWKAQAITDWDYRWEFSGRGSINREVAIKNVVKRPDDFFEVSFSHIKYGDQTLLLDPNLQLVDQLDNRKPLTDYFAIEGHFPGLDIRLFEDLNSEDSEETKYVLQWESLGSNRDRPRPKPWPAASALYLQMLEKNGGDLHNSLSDISSVEDLIPRYQERLKALFSSIDLNYPGLDAVQAAWENNDLLNASLSLLEYYREKINQENPQTLPPVATGMVPAAEAVLNDIITVQGRSGIVPRMHDGMLDWHYRGPQEDMEWAWGFNRHYHLNTLLEAYLETGNNDYVRAIDTHLKDWILSSLPYPATKSRTAMWRGLEVSHRVKTWARIFHELNDHPDLSPATRLLIISSLPEHAHYAQHFHGKNNWLTMEMSGLALVAALWPEFLESSNWLNYTKKQMVSSLKAQVYPDGVQTELTSHYHYVALNNFNQFMRTCVMAGETLPDTFHIYLEKMWDYLAHTMRPDGFGILNNDSDRDYNRDRILAAAAFYERPDWHYLATYGMEGEKPNRPLSSFYPWAGQLLMRDEVSSQSQWAFFDVGPWGSGHQHNDKLNLSIAAFGVDFLVDAGRFAYQGEMAEKFRGYARSTQGHNTLLIDGQGQDKGPLLAEKSLPELHAQVTDDFDYAWGEVDHFIDLEKVSHTRSVFYRKGKYWLIVDEVQTDQPRQVEALWHWHPQCQVTIGEEGEIVATRAEGSLLLQPLGDIPWVFKLVKGQEKPAIQGWYSERYNQAEPNPTAIYQTDIQDTTTLAWLIYPQGEGIPNYIAKILSTTAEGLEVQMQAGELNEQIYVPLRDARRVRNDLTNNPK